MAAKPDRKLKVVADNRRARFNYEIGETFEAGIALTGTEVKALRQGRATIAESYADSRGGELWLLKLYFNEKGRAKLEIAIARGKKMHDKRESDRKRTWNRERARLLRNKG